jgi:putative ABC transport system permease protein
MLNSDLKVALRNIRKNKGLSAINIFGLAFGLACCLLLSLWIRDEFRYDRFHKKADRIYRLEYSELKEGREVRFARTSAPAAPALLAEFPEIERAVRLGRNDFQVVCQGRQFHETVFFADPAIFEIFSFVFVQGDLKTALAAPANLVISETTGRKYFGEENPVGKTLTLRDYRDFKVAGVFKDIPRDSHLHFDFLGQFAAYAGRTQMQWGVYNYWTYLLASPGFEEAAFLRKLPAFVKKHQPYLSPDLDFRYLVRPLTRIHLYGDARGEIEANGHIGTVYIFAAIVLFILFVAGSNYVNFATAQYAARRREVGIRKAVGASRGQIAVQFLRESILLAVIALFLAFLITGLSIPAFSAVTGKDFTPNIVLDPGVAAGALGLGVLAGFLAGLYPALFLSSAPPAQILRGLFLGRPKGAAVRNVLVIVQFSISVVFLVGTFVITRQMNFVRTTPLGLSKENVLTIAVDDATALAEIEAVKAEMGRVPGVVSISAGSFKPGPNVWRQNYWHEGMSENEYPTLAWMSVDDGYLKTLGIELAAGRDFSPKFPSDKGQAYLLNEAAVRELGWTSPESALGRAFRIVDKGTIIGVVKNFHCDSLHNEIEPLALYFYPPGFEYLYVRLRPEHLADTLAALKATWQNLAPSQDFAFSFLDEEFDRLYRAEIRLRKIFSAVTGAALFIAGLGLLGLAALTARYRTKEIGVRKTLGASTGRIVAHLTRRFVRWVLVANLMAWPVAYYVMNRWLRNFAYRTTLSPWLFFAAGGLALVLAFLAVGWQSIRAARANPAESLRYE